MVPSSSWLFSAVGLDGVPAFYADIFRGFPDFHIDVTQRHVSDEAIILEAIISGTHKNEWFGIPASGRAVRFPLCCVFPFDDSDRITGERAYFDSALLLRQLGVCLRNKRFGSKGCNAIKDLACKIAYSPWLKDKKEKLPERAPRGMSENQMRILDGMLSEASRF
jgi:steroid delta-isomerase-like uncharacterized protein